MTAGPQGAPRPRLLEGIISAPSEKLRNPDSSPSGQPRRRPEAASALSLLGTVSPKDFTCFNEADALEPRLVLCGHLHKRYRGTLAHASGRVSQVCCLASVEQGADAFAVFHATATGLHEVTRLGAPEQG